MIQFWIGFIGWPVIIIATIWLNYYRIDVRKKKPHYLSSNWSRAVFGLACLVLMTIELGFDPAYLYTWKPVLPYIGYIGGSFYLFFDPGLNLLREKAWDYQGKDSGLLDKLKKPMYYGLKVISLAVLIFSLIKIFPR